MNSLSFATLQLPSLTTNRVVWAIAIFSATFAVSLVICGVVIVRIPATYFLDHNPYGAEKTVNPFRRWTLRILKNLLGLFLVVAGVVMLVTPGQGILTILIGVTLLDFPGKRRLERKLIGRPKVFRAVNRLRARFGKPPLILDPAALPVTPS
jgi:hypothetical protein